MSAPLTYRTRRTAKLGRKEAGPSACPRPTLESMGLTGFGEAQPHSLLNQDHPMEQGIQRITTRRRRQEP